jgi:hypothetical protein
MIVPTHEKEHQMQSTYRTLARLAAAVSIALAAPAFAHPGGMGAGSGNDVGTESGCGYGPGAGGMGMHGAMGMGMGMHGAMGMGPMNGRGGYGNPAAATEGRLAYLKTELKITSNQEAAWNAFATGARKQAEGMQALREKMQENKGTAPERLALHAEAMKQRAATMDGVAAGLKDLYAALTTEQKTILDQHFQRHGPKAVAWNNSGK